MERLNRKFETARSFVPRPEITKGNNAKIGIIGYGTSHWGITESRDQLRDEYDIETDYLRLARVSVHPRSARVHRAARARLSSSSRIATRKCSAC